MKMTKLKNNKSGPWDVPLKDYVKVFELMVIITNIATDIVEKEIKINYGNFEDRKWLGRITYWAATNKRIVETMSLEDWKNDK